LVADSVPIHRETYLAIVLDRESNGPVIVASSNGGMDIEETAELHPELIIKEKVNISTGVTDEQCLKIAEALKFTGKMKEEAAFEIKQLYDLFIELDAVQIEINPFVESSENRVFCIDAKINVDENASFRQKELFETAEDGTECEDAKELQAHKTGLNYVGLDGDIACLGR
jgi:succinyl-CoA synthetase beta subunit